MRFPRQPGRKPISIIVAYADVMASRFVCTELERNSQFELVGCAATVNELLELFQVSTAKVALISATLKDGLLSGLALLPQLREQYPAVRVILMIDLSPTSKRPWRSAPPCRKGNRSPRLPRPRSGSRGCRHLPARNARD